MKTVYCASILLGSVALLGATPASAQCGYGTGQQDCMHQQQAAAHRAEQERMAREQQERQEQQRRYEEQSRQGGNSGGGYEQQQFSPPSVAVNWISGHVAVAWHANASDVWATWNQRTDEAAKSSALEACGKAMGEGCAIANGGSNSSVAIVQGHGAELYNGWGVTPEDASAQATKFCTAKTEQCKVKRLFTAEAQIAPGNLTPENYFPSTEAAGYMHVMVAWPKTKVSPQWAQKVWIVSGRVGYIQSVQALLGKCKSDVGVECAVTHFANLDRETGAYGVISNYNNPKSGSMWGARASKKAAEIAMKAECAKDQVTCTNLRIFDAATPRLEAVDDPWVQ